MRIGILNLQYSNNYGAVLSSYALKHTISGEYPIICINYVPDIAYDLNKNFDAFRSRFLNIAPVANTKAALRRLYNNLDMVIVGSDQVFRLRYVGSNSPNFMDWIYGEKIIISYAASFGTKNFEGNRFCQHKIHALLKRFDALSVRESSGVSIMKNTFGLNAVQVLDPTLLLGPDDYQPIIDSEPCQHPQKYVGVMFLDEEHWDEFKKSALFAKLSAEYEIVNIVKDEQRESRSVPQWLDFIKHADLMVTDSFHGTVFSIIYKKQFITRATANRGNARIKSLCDTLFIPRSRFYAFFDEKDASQFDEILDYGPIYQRIAEERKVSLDFLKKSLELPPAYKEFIPERRDRLSIPLLTIEEREHDKRLLLFGCIPVVTKPNQSSDLLLFGKVPCSCSVLTVIKSKVRKLVR